MGKIKTSVAAFLCVALIGLLAGCSSGQNKEMAIPDTNVITEEGPSASTTAEPTAVDSINKGYLDTTKSIDERAEILLNQMTLEEKAGQMLQAERNTVKESEVTKLALGSVLSGGGSYPGNNSISDWNNMIHNLQEAAMKSRLGIPLLYGIDAVHGQNLLKGAVVYPHNVGLGAANDADLMYQMGAAVAEEMKLTGTLWNFAPCVAVGQDPRWGRTYESFSSDPKIVTTLSSAYLKGLQTHGVVGTAKHYVGDGGTSYGSGIINGILDRGDVVVSEKELRKIHLAPYKELIKDGAKIVMASFSSYKGTKMHENKYLLTDVLKNELGFKGFVVSDWEAVKDLEGESFEANIAFAVNAGVDMLMEPFNYDEAIKDIIANVNKGTIAMARVDDAVRRILKVKLEMGLFEDPYMEKLNHDVKKLGSDEYKSLAKQLVEKSLVLLKNEKKTLPLKKGSTILVIGPAADDMGVQCGGWMTTWQGFADSDGKRAAEGLTILEGLEEYAKQYDLTIITDKDKASQADAVILAVGEMPYAEYEGDTTDLSITGKKGLEDNKDAIEYAKSLGKPTVALIVAGRNVLITNYMKDWDSIVMCYLPGTEGDGVASVLTGETSFTGKLAMPYYKHTKDIGSKKSSLLFPLGYGLTY